MAVVELYPAYRLGCKRCHQDVWIHATTVQFGGDRTGLAVALDRYGPEAVEKIYNLDLDVAQLRAQGVNAPPPGLNLHVLPDRVRCDHCKMQYPVAPLLRGHRLEDAGAFNCVRCGREGFTRLEVLEDERSCRLPEATFRNFLGVIRQGWGQPLDLLTIASLRLVAADDCVTVIERLSVIPAHVHCMYCGLESACKLLEPPPLR